MHKWYCDACGKRTYMVPKSEPVFEDGVPKTVTMKRQNPETGAVENVAIPECRDLQPRNYIVSVRAGSERVQRSFCHCCLDLVRTELQALWMKLETQKGHEDDEEVGNADAGL